MNRLLPTPAELAAAGGYLSRCRPYLARLQQERRRRMVRIDYMPGTEAMAILEAHRAASNSAMLDAIVIEWAALTGID